MKPVLILNKTPIQTTNRKTMVLFTIEKILSQEIDFEELQHKIKKIFSKILKQKKNINQRFKLFAIISN